MAEPLPLLIPHPTLTHGRTAYALARDEVNHVGEAVAMVVARDRYLAEDAAERIGVRYEPLPRGGGDRGRPGRGRTSCTTTCRATSPPAWSRRTATPRAAIAAAPHRLTLDLHRRAHARPCRWRAEATSPGGTPTSRRLRIWTSTQTSTGVRAAVAAKLRLDLGQVEVITPDVGGGFGVKINHPWPEEVLVPLAARALRPAGEVHRGPPRALHLLSPRARAGAPRRGRLRRRRAAARPGRCGSGTTTAPTRRTG